MMKEELQDVSETILSFEAATWPSKELLIDGYARWTTVHMCGASENYEVFEGETRRLLYQIADTDTQHMYAVDLLDASDDPAVYYFDHEDPQDTFYRPFPRLSLFLASLKTKAVAATCKRSEEWESLFRATLATGEAFRAMELAAEAHAQHPAKPDFLTYLAVGRAQARDQIKAEELYRQALEIDANHSYSLRNLGILLAHKGDHGAAQGLLERLVARDPTSASGHYILACAHASGGRKPAMLAALKQAIALDPSTRQQMLKERDFDAFKSDADFVALSANGSR